MIKRSNLNFSVITNILTSSLESSELYSFQYDLVFPYPVFTYMFACISVFIFVYDFSSYG